MLEQSNLDSIWLENHTAWLHRMSPTASLKGLNTWVAWEQRLHPSPSLTWSTWGCSSTDQESIAVMWQGPCDSGRSARIHWSLWLIGGGALRPVLPSFRLTLRANHTHLNKEFNSLWHWESPGTWKRAHLWPRMGKTLQGKAKPTTGWLCQPYWEEQSDPSSPDPLTSSSRTIPLSSSAQTYAGFAFPTCFSVRALRVSVSTQTWSLRRHITSTKHQFSHLNNRD